MSAAAGCTTASLSRSGAERWRRLLPTALTKPTCSDSALRASTSSPLERRAGRAAGSLRWERRSATLAPILRMRNRLRGNAAFWSASFGRSTSASLAGLGLRWSSGATNGWTLPPRAWRRGDAACITTAATPTLPLRASSRSTSSSCATRAMRPSASCTTTQSSTRATRQRCRLLSVTSFLTLWRGRVSGTTIKSGAWAGTGPPCSCRTATC
mmetsp:Transcript_20720/g.53099  ORF Transcript_20720/g.53099 Transcript_20720/m.53099 type:complete len:212 (-) Transcript_20720:411-1046(-)